MGRARSFSQFAIRRSVDFRTFFGGSGCIWAKHSINMESAVSFFLGVDSVRCPASSRLHLAQVSRCLGIKCWS